MRQSNLPEIRKLTRRDTATATSRPVEKVTLSMNLNTRPNVRTR
jgi:hypothetical protein